MTRHRHRSPAQVFRLPALLAGLSLFGLVGSLVGDGAWDAGGALALLVPAGVGLAKLLPARPRGQGEPAYPIGQRSFS